MDCMAISWNSPEAFAKVCQFPRSRTICHELQTSPSLARIFPSNLESNLTMARILDRIIRVSDLPTNLQYIIASENKSQDERILREFSISPDTLDEITLDDLLEGIEGNPEYIYKLGLDA